MNVTLLNLHIASVFTNSAVLSKTARLTSGRFSMDSCRFSQLLCPVAMIPHLRATITKTSISKVSTPYVFEATDYSHMVFTTELTVDTVESYFECCLFENISGKSLIKHDSTVSSQCTLESCMVRNVQLIDKIIESARNSSFLNSFVDNISGALSGPGSIRTEGIKNWQMNIQGLSITDSSLGGQTDEYDIHGNKIVIISDQHSSSSMNISRCLFSQHLAIDDPTSGSLHEYFYWRHCQITHCTVDESTISMYQTLNCLISLALQTGGDVLSLENVIINDVVSDDANKPLDTIFYLELTSRTSSEYTFRFTDLCFVDCDNVNAIKFDFLWSRANALAIFTRCFFEAMEKPMIYKTEMNDVDFQAQICPVHVLPNETPVQQRKVFDYGIIAGVVEQFEIVNI